MKIRLLAVPLLAILIIMVAIWMISPAYSNGLDGVKEKKRELAAINNKISDLEIKAEKAEELDKILKESEGEQKVLSKYVPDEKLEEEIVDKLNYIASSSGLFIFKLSVSDSQRTLSSVANVPSASYSIPQNKETDKVAAIEESSEKIALKNSTPVDLVVNFGVLGNYGSVKTLIEKVQKIKRFNDPLFLSIKNVSLEGKDASATVGDKIQAEMALNFSFLKRVNSISNVNEGIFSEGKFNMAAIEKIRSNVSDTDVPITVESSGRPNPFIP